MSGLKYDCGKVRMELIPPEADLSLARVLTFGASKYGDNQWQELDNGINRYLGALKRHLARFQQEPKGKDAESGLYHIEHILCNAMFLTYLILKKELNEDLFCLPKNQKEILKQIKINTND